MNIWFKNIISAILPGGPAETIGQGARTFEKKAKARLIDVTDGVHLADAARKKSGELVSLLLRGGERVDRFRLWMGARKKVKKNVMDAYDMPELLDEITEKIVEASKEDPFYRRLFS